MLQCPRRRLQNATVRSRESGVPMVCQLHRLVDFRTNRSNVKAALKTNNRNVFPGLSWSQPNSHEHPQNSLVMSRSTA